MVAFFDEKGEPLTLKGAALHGKDLCASFLRVVLSDKGMNVPPSVMPFEKKGAGLSLIAAFLEKQGAPFALKGAPFGRKGALLTLRHVSFDA